MEVAGETVAVVTAESFAVTTRAFEPVEPTVRVNASSATPSAPETVAVPVELVPAVPQVRVTEGPSTVIPTTPVISPAESRIEVEMRFVAAAVQEAVSVTR